ncbi:MAG: pectin acetylesterase-family hydrolase [Sandaracinaceae bacterium]
MRTSVGLVFLLVVACDGGAPEADASIDAAPVTDATPAPDASPADAGLAAPLDEALDCRRAGSAGGLPGGTHLTRVDVDLDRYPDALCNDGTGGVFFVRRATRAEDADRWIVQLLGGGTCQDGQSCANRFCASGSAIGALKMSSREAPTRGTTGEGISSMRADNPFATWNHVVIWYCSSDAWSGTARDVALEADHPERPGEPVRYRLHFLGSEIFDAVVDTLRAAPFSYRDASGDDVVMPDLDEARTVLLAGASAGSGGVRNQIDRFAEALRSDNPAVDVRAVLDAVMAPAREALGYADSALCRERDVCTYEAHLRPVWEETRPLRGAVGDESCPAWHAANDPGSEWRCGDLDHVLRHHITTPFFFRQDQADGVVMPNTVDLGYTVPSRGDAPMDARLFAELIAEEAATLTTSAWWSGEAHEGAGVAVIPGAFSPRCGHHETLRTESATYGVRVEQDGTQRAPMGLLAAWLAGDPVRAIAGDPSTFTCP